MDDYSFLGCAPLSTGMRNAINRERGDGCVNDVSPSLRGSVPESEENLRSYWVRFQKWSIKYLSNPIEIAAEIMPEWSAALAAVPAAYGHFSFPTDDASKICVYLTVVDAARYGMVLRKSLSTVFAAHYLEVLQWNIRDLSAEAAAEAYHQEALRKPLDNLYYQLFLTAISDGQWWETYRVVCPQWEIDHYLARFLRTHLEAYLGAMSEAEAAMETGQGGKSLFLKAEEWRYITEPFLRCGWDRERLEAAMEKVLGAERWERERRWIQRLW